MAYAIGIDVGTTYTAAAICRSDGRSCTSAEAVGLGTRSTATASVVYLGEDGQWLVGDAAERRAQDRPDLVIREFKRRLGDPIPLVVAGQRHKAEAISANVVRWVVDRVAEQEGGPASAITLTHPASWGAYKRSLVQKAIEDVGLTDVTFLTEPVAAAAHYAAQTRVGVGSTIAVYDLGGGTFDAAVVRKVGDQSFELQGTPQGIDRLGGLDFDEAVFSHLRTVASLPPVDPTDADAVAAMIRLRRECSEAKEALSADTEATIPVMLPGLHTRVRLVRREFEELIHDAVEETVEALKATVDSGGVALQDVNAVLLVGGSSRIPLIAQLVSERLQRPVVVDADPKAAIALGAAVIAASRVDWAAEATRQAQAARPVAAAPVPKPRPAAPAPRPFAAAAAHARRHRRRVSTGTLVAALGVAVVAGSAVAVVWPPESDSERPAVVEARGTTSADAASVAGAESPDAVSLNQSMLVPAVPVVDVLTPLITPEPPPAPPPPAPTSDEAELTAAIPLVGAVVPTPEPESPTTTSGGSNGNGTSSGGGGSTGQTAGTSGGTSGTTAGTTAGTTGTTGAPASAGTTTSPPTTAGTTTPAPTTSSPPDTTPAPTDPPPTDPPPTDPPPTDPPATDPPATDPPATDPPATDPPATDPPATDPPATDPPATDPPATDPPATDPPATDPPADTQPAETTAASEDSAPPQP